MQRRAKKWNWKGMVLLLIAFIAAGAGVFFAVHKKPIPVKTITPVRRDLQKELFFNGVIQPIKTVSVYSPVSGTLLELLVKEGTIVSKEQLLFRVDPDRQARQELDDAEASLRRTRNELQTKNDELDRRLRVSNYIEKETLKSLQAEVETRRIAAEEAERKYNILKKALGVKQEKRKLVQVFAPISGTVTLVSKDAGATLFAGSTTSGTTTTVESVMVLSDMSQVLARTKVSESDIAMVREGLPVEINLLSFKDKMYFGRISRVSPQGIRDQGSQAAYFEVDASILNPDPLLRANLSATLKVLVARRNMILTLPRTAVATMRGNSVVELADGKYKRVQTGLMTDTDVEILPGSIDENTAVKEIDFAKLDMGMLASGTLGRDTQAGVPPPSGPLPPLPPGGMEGQGLLRPPEDNPPPPVTGQQ